MQLSASCNRAKPESDQHPECAVAPVQGLFGFEPEAADGSDASANAQRQPPDSELQKRLASRWVGLCPAVLFRFTVTTFHDQKIRCYPMTSCLVDFARWNPRIVGSTSL